MTYRPKEFWDQRLREQFDLRGTGETGLSVAYNEACYRLRREVLDRALAEAGADPAGERVLDVGCGTGFFTGYYLERGARVTGIDIAPTSIERLTERYPQATFILGDISETPVTGTFAIVNAFDVLYHITDDARWESAVRHLARAVASGGVLLLTDRFARFRRMDSHNIARMLDRYEPLLTEEGLRVAGLHETHVLLNRELGVFRFLNRFPGLLLAVDRRVLAMRRRPRHSDANTLLVARRS
jgi:SAM-dependent methyltransferase